MAETDLEPFQEVCKRITQELPKLYEVWYPLDHIVKKTNALNYKIITQAGVLYFESRDITHFIAGTNRLYDLKVPMEYEHKVYIYRPEKSEWSNVFYGTEMECHAYVIAEQSKRYGFDYNEYMRGQGKIKILEQKLQNMGKDFNQKEQDHVQELIEITLRNVRLKLDLADDNDLPQLTLEEAIEESQRP